MALRKVFFTECQTGGTRQRFFKNPKGRLCWVLVSGHSAKRSLPSAGSRALGKIYFLINFFCRVPDRVHSAKNVTLTEPSVATFSPFTLSLLPLHRSPPRPPRSPRSPRHATSVVAALRSRGPPSSLRPSPRHATIVTTTPPSSSPLEHHCRRGDPGDSAPRAAI
jgi:hypothetical protein